MEWVAMTLVAPKKKAIVELHGHTCKNADSALCNIEEYYQWSSATIHEVKYKEYCLHRMAYKLIDYFYKVSLSFA